MAEATVTVLGRYGAYPGPGGAGRGYLLRAADHALLVGCGSGVAGRLAWLLGTGGTPDAVLLPDLRPDHTSDLWAVGSMAAVAAAAGRRRGLLLVHAFGEPEADWRRLHRPGVLDVRRLAAGDQLRLGPWRLTFAPSAHAWPGVAVRAEGPGGASWVLTGLGMPDEALAALARGAQLVVAETGGPRTGFDEGLDGGMSPAAAGALAARAGAAGLLLAHLLPDEEAAVALAEACAAFPDAELALEGRTYDLAPPEAASPRG